MSINLAELVEGTGYHNHGAIPLLYPNEKVLYATKSERQSLSINSTKESESKIRIKASYGIITLTNERFLYSTTSQGDFNSFVLNLRDMHRLQFSHKLVSPMFGANYWQFLFYNPLNGPSNITPQNNWLQGEIKFNDGGLFTFLEHFNESVNDVMNNRDIDEELPQYTEET